MPGPDPELLNLWTAARADTALALLTVLAMGGLARQVCRTRTPVKSLPGGWYVAAGVVMLGTIGLAELGTSVSIGAPEPYTVFFRAVALGSGVVIAGIVLAVGIWGAILNARLEAQIHTEQQLQEAKRAADSANRAKSDFLAVMSHEMRTPLNAVKGFATLLAETPLDSSQQDYVRTITSETVRLSAMINDILDLTKIEEGRLTLERLPFSPVETTQEVLRLMQTRVKEQRLDLRFEAQTAGPLLVTGDPLRFHQVLLNLVDNAVKFTPYGSVTVFLSWQPPSEAGGMGKLGVRVKDTGIGIPRDKLDHLFQMFVQADTSTTRRYGGTGLGLAICQRLVRMMGGEIVVQSAPGVGSEFIFVLPCTPVSPPTASAPAPKWAAKGVRRPRVLVVDDLETNRFLLEVFLERSGFNPELASGGEEAVRLALQNSYDAILMDLQMPDIDGFTATQRIRAAEPPGRHTPILALTATITRGTREKCLAAGMDEHLTKPLDLARFKQLLEGLIRCDPPDCETVVGQPSLKLPG